MTIASNHKVLNPYAAPKAQVEDVSVIALDEPPLFSVGLPKLAIMSVVTLGLYEIFWFYRNWKSVQQLTGQKVNAPIRAVFYPVTAYFLFRAIRTQAETAQVKVSFQAGMLAILLFLLSSLWRLPDPYWLITYLGFLPLLPVQAVANEINRKLAPQANPNTRFRGWNIVGLLLGGAMFALTVTGAFFK